MAPHFAYQGAKILSYTLVGLLLGTIGAALDLKGIRGWAMLGAGVYMVLLGLQMTGKFPWLAFLTPRPPKFLMNALVKLRRKATADASEGDSSLMTPISFGLMTGLMPCGPLISAQIAAAATGSALLGAVGMFAFGLGTMPLMLGFGAVSGLLSGTFKRRMMVGLAFVVMALGLVMFNRGLTLTGSPITYNTVAASVTGADAAATSYKKGADGVVEIPITIANVKFAPENVSIPADQPVRLVVDRREDNACSDQLAIPQAGVLKNLAPNAVTTVDVPAMKAGTYTLTCGMGMMAGTLAVGAGAGSPVGGGANLALLGLGVLAVGGWFVWRRRTAGAPAKKGPAAKGSASTVPAWLRFSKAEYGLFAVALLTAVVTGLMLGGGIR
jgi:sulfite exporter TauE/SafE